MTPEIEFLIGMLPPFAVAISLYVLIPNFLKHLRKLEICLLEFITLFL